MGASRVSSGFDKQFFTTETQGHRENERRIQMRKRGKIPCMKQALLGSALLFLYARVMTSAQAQEPQEVIPAPHARVELRIDKKVYGRREPITFRAILVNDDTRGFYISKSFYGAGGGVAGFYVYGTQLSGRRG